VAEIVWKIVEADDGNLSADDLLVVSVLLADAIRRHDRRSPGHAFREREIWEKLQPVLRTARGWTRRDDGAAAGASGESSRRRAR
jgi:hypothetical protein